MKLAGFEPLLVPNIFFNANGLGENDLLCWLNNFNIGGLLISGGNDIGLAKKRDYTEICLLNWAKEKLLPVLGICRGMQLMGVHSGSKLKRINGHVKQNHHLIIASKDDLWPKNVNSFHNYALEVVPEGWKLSASAPCGNIEAIVHNHLRWEGWMWHPERKAKYNEIDLLRFKRLMVNED